MVGDDTVQIPERITHKTIICSNFKQRRAMLLAFIEQNKDKKILIFTETKDEAKEFQTMNPERFLVLHGDLEQNQREIKLKQYRNSKDKHILVATDVASRGLDIDDIDIVV